MARRPARRWDGIIDEVVVERIICGQGAAGAYREEVRAAIRLMIDTDLTDTEVAHRAGVNIRTVYRVQSEVRGTEMKVQIPRVDSTAQRERIAKTAELTRAGFSAGQIASALGIHPRTAVKYRNMAEREMSK